MPANLERLDRKRDAILAKTDDEIARLTEILTFLASPPTRAQVRTWANDRAAFLLSARNATDQQVTAGKASRRTALGTADRVLWDAIEADGRPNLAAASTLAAFTSLVELVLFRFVFEDH